MATFRWKSSATPRDNDARHQQQQGPLSAAPSSSSRNSPPGKGVPKRTKVREEIISSEETYVRELRTLVAVFLRPLEKWVAEEGVHGQGIPAGSVSAIFSNAEEILAFNEQFLRDLATCDGGGVTAGRRRSIGAIFRKQPLDMFKPYSVYVKNYPQAVKRLAACEECSEFKAFVRGCEHQEACHGLDLRAYLIQPVQRVPRYRLLLMEMLKHTRESHPDWADLNAALENVSSTAAKLNQGARDQERFIRALELQNEFGQNFLKPSSHLVKEGDMLKVCNGGPRRYKFVLFSDMLIYGTETMRAKLQRDHRKYKVHRRIPLYECLVLDYGSSDSFVVSRPSGKSFVALTVSAEEKQAWLDAFAESFAEMDDEQQAGTGSGNLNAAADSSPISEASSKDRGYEDEWNFAAVAGQQQQQQQQQQEDVDGKNDIDNDIIENDDEEDITPVFCPQKTKSAKKLQTSLGISFPSGGVALAQTVTASMMSGRWSLTGGGGGSSTGGGGGGRNSLTSHATSGGGSSPPSERSSFARRRSAPCVHVWVPLHGRTELQEISLVGLPPGSTSGVFKVHQKDATNNNGTSSAGAVGEERPLSGLTKYRLLATLPGLYAASSSFSRSEASSYQRSRSPSPRRLSLGTGGLGGASTISGGGGAGEEAVSAAARKVTGRGGEGAAEVSVRGRGVDSDDGGNRICAAGDVGGGVDVRDKAGAKVVELGAQGHERRRGSGSKWGRLQATAMSSFSDDVGEDSDSYESEDDAEKAFDMNIEGSKRSSSATGESRNVHTMLAKLEASKQAKTLIAQISHVLGGKGGDTSDNNEEVPAASVGAAARTTAEDADIKPSRTYSAEDDQQKQQTWGAEEEEEAFAYRERHSSSFEVDYVNPMVLRNQGLTRADGTRRFDDPDGAAVPAACPANGTENGGGGDSGGGGGGGGDSGNGAPGKQKTNMKKGISRPSRFLRQSRSLTHIIKQRRTPSPQKAGKKRDKSDGHDGGRSRSNSPPRTSSGIFETLQKGFRERVMNNARRRSTSTPARKRWSAGDSENTLAGLFARAGGGQATAAVPTADRGRRRSDGDQAAPQRLSPAPGLCRSGLEDTQNRLPVESRDDGEVDVERDETDGYNSTYSTLLGEACLDVEENC